MKNYTQSIIYTKAVIYKKKITHNCLYV